MLVTDNWMWDKPSKNNLDKYISSFKNANILDLGCGKGKFAKYLSSLGAFVTAVDIYNSFEWNDCDNKNINFVLANAECLPFESNSFDFVVSCSTFQYMDHKLVIKELIRITKNNGVILLHENMPSNPIIVVYRFIRKLKAVFNISLKKYILSIKSYISPSKLKKDLLFKELIIEETQCYYLFSAMIFSVPRVSFIKFIQKFLFRLDEFLLLYFPTITKLSWFCTYKIRICKN